MCCNNVISRCVFYSQLLTPSQAVLPAIFLSSHEQLIPPPMSILPPSSPHRYPSTPTQTTSSPDLLAAPQGVKPWVGCSTGLSPQTTPRWWTMQVHFLTSVLGPLAISCLLSAKYCIIPGILTIWCWLLLFFQVNLPHQQNKKHVSNNCCICGWVISLNSYLAYQLE